MSAKILIALSIAYGFVIAVMGSFSLPGIRAVAIIGALVLGAAWIARALFFNKTKDEANT